MASDTPRAQPASPARDEMVRELASLERGAATAEQLENDWTML